MLLRILLIMVIVGWTFAAQAADGSSLREHADITEWAAKGLIIFFQFEIWRNQRTLFTKYEETSERVAKIEGICQGRKEAGEKC